jgi:hypothetical protein
MNLCCVGLYNRILLKFIFIRICIPFLLICSPCCKLLWAVNFAMWDFLEIWKIIEGVFRGENSLGNNGVERNTHTNMYV